MVVTKEKILAAVALALCAMMLSGLRMPHADPIPEVFEPESQRRFRVLGGLPVVGPDYEVDLERDPFVVQDAWAPMQPEPIGLPERTAWTRALPGGPLNTPRTRGDRVRVTRTPAAGTPAEVQK